MPGGNGLAWHLPTDDAMEEMAKTMVRKWKCLACTAGLLSLSFGCVNTREQISDLRTPPAPKLTWSKPSDSKRNRPPVLAGSQDLVIREHRFVSHSAELNLDGETQIHRIAAALKETPHCLVIESSEPTPALRVVSQRSPEESSKLDQQRREYVIQKLLSLGIPDAESRVVLEADNDSPRAK